jgi:uroporphyrinogen decarboxylase
MTSKSLLEVLKNGTPRRRPIWVMRQAGRYLPEYREVRAKAGSFLGLCYHPEHAAEVTLQPLRRYDLDAAILFSDILVVPHAMGLALDFVEGEGPKLETVTDMAGVGKLKDGMGSHQFARVMDTVRAVKTELRPHVGFIGFCGAPWTVASYMIEGGSSRRQLALAVAAENPPWFQELLHRLISVSIVYLCQQIESGVEVLQVFDSWAGDVPTEHRDRVVTGPMREIIEGVRAVYPGFPVIAFARGVSDGHADVALKTAANCMGVEQGVSLREVLNSMPKGVAVQGNLDPDVLLAGGDVIRAEVTKVLEGVAKERHVFNLGHGITPQVDPAAVGHLISAVRDFDGKSGHV